jgi:hypothetical protein
MLDLNDTTTETRARFDTSDVPMGGGETLRVGLEYDRHGRPIVLHLALGIGTGRDWRECTEAGFGIPPDRVGPLVRALLRYL